MYSSIFSKKAATPNIITLHHNICGNFAIKPEIFIKNHTKAFIVSVVSYFIFAKNLTKMESVMNIQEKNWKKLRKKIIFSDCQNIRNKSYKSLSQNNLQ